MPGVLSWFFKGRKDSSSQPGAPSGAGGAAAAGGGGADGGCLAAAPPHGKTAHRALSPAPSSMGLSTSASSQPPPYPSAVSPSAVPNLATAVMSQPSPPRREPSLQKSNRGDSRAGSTSGTHHATDVTWQGALVDSDEDSVVHDCIEEDPLAEISLRLSHAKERLRERINDVLRNGSASFTSAREMSVSIATFNVGEKIPRSSPHYLAWLLSLKQGGVTGDTDYVDIVAVGLQEIDMSAGSVVLEETPAKARVWEGFIASQLEQVADYVKVKSVCMSGLLLLVFAKEAAASQCVNVSSAVIRIGERGLANKGAVGVRLTIGGRRVLFLNTHLDAHTEKLQKRNRGYERIISDLRFPLPAQADEPMDLVFNRTLVMQQQREEEAVQRQGSSALPTPEVPVLMEHPLYGAGGGPASFLVPDEQGAMSSSSSSSGGPYTAGGYDFRQYLIQLLALLPPPVGVLVKEEIRESMEADRRHCASGFGTSGGLSGAANGSNMSMGGDAASSSNDSLEAELGGPQLSPRTFQADEADEEDLQECFVHSFDYVFWFGDLNYRLWNIPNRTVRSMVAESKLDELLKFDQLRQTLATRTAFGGFEESEIKFPPTYKFDPGTTTYDTSSKQRAPSWTDRVLYLIRPHAAFPPAPQSGSSQKGSSSRAVPMGGSSHHTNAFHVGSFYSCEDASSYRQGLHTMRSDHSPHGGSGPYNSWLAASVKSKHRSASERGGFEEKDTNSPIPLCGNQPSHERSQERGGSHEGGHSFIHLASTSRFDQPFHSALSVGHLPSTFQEMSLLHHTGHMFPNLNEVAVVDSAPEFHALMHTDAESPAARAAPRKPTAAPMHLNVLKPDAETYRSHPVLLSDHRPVSSKFKFACIHTDSTAAGELLASDAEAMELCQRVAELSTRLEQMRFGDETEGGS